MLEQKLQRIAKAVSNPSEPPAEARKSREEFIRLYPKEKWATMTLEEFVIGSGQQTACWWIEFNTPALGALKGDLLKRSRFIWPRTVNTVMTRNPLTHHPKHG